MESSVNYDRPIEGDPMNNIYWIHDTHFACFAILEFPSINHRMLYLLKFRDRQIFLNPVFLEIFFSIFYRLPWDKEMPKKLQIILPSISSKLILVEQHCWSEEENKFCIFFFCTLILTWNEGFAFSFFKETFKRIEERNRRGDIDWIIDYGEIKKMGFVVAFTCILDYISATLSISTLEQYLENGKISSALGMRSLMCLVVL